MRHWLVGSVSTAEPGQGRIWNARHEWPRDKTRNGLTIAHPARRALYARAPHLWTTVRSGYRGKRVFPKHRGASSSSACRTQQTSAAAALSIRVWEWPGCSIRVTERVIISSSSVRMMRTVVRLASEETPSQSPHCAKHSVQCLGSPAPHRCARATGRGFFATMAPAGPSNQALSVIEGFSGMATFNM